MATTLPELLQQTAFRWSGSDLPPLDHERRRRQIRVHGHADARSDMPAPRRRRDQAAGLQRAHRRAEEALRGDARARLLVRHQAAWRASAATCSTSAARSAPSTVLIPEKIRSFQELSAAARASATLAERPRGLVLVTGPTGSRQVDDARGDDRQDQHASAHEHILTIEDPIEFVHQHKSCLVNQREVHSDTQSFAMALRAALREDPDIVLIGEMRDLETVEVGADASPRRVT